MHLFVLYNLIVLIVGVVQKDKKLQLVGGIGIGIGIISYGVLFIAFGFSDM